MEKSILEEYSQQNSFCFFHSSYGHHLSENQQMIIEVMLSTIINNKSFKLKIENVTLPHKSFENEILATLNLAIRFPTHSISLSKSFIFCAIFRFKTNS